MGVFCNSFFAQLYEQSQSFSDNLIFIFQKTASVACALEIIASFYEDSYNGIVLREHGEIELMRRQKKD